MIVALAGCGRSSSTDTSATTTSTNTATTPAPAAVHVTSMELGKGLKADKHVETVATAFGPSETIYLAVATDGTAPGTLKARWIDASGNVVEETTQSIASAGPAVTEFHITKPTGLPTGSYTVEILVDDVSAGRRDFTIK